MKYMYDYLKKVDDDIMDMVEKESRGLNMHMEKGLYLLLENRAHIKAFMAEKNMLGDMHHESKNPFGGV